ncbi:MAG: hypothetical protein J6K18_00265 [Bacilli bacterium]|nr:hypothetical protein [Bacilli bacterium]
MNYFLILDVLVLIILAICLLGGLIRGFKKSLRKLIALAIPTICLFIFLGPITNAVMEKEVDLGKINNIVDIIPEEYTEETYSINGALTMVVSNYIYPDDASLQEESEVKELASAISTMVIKIVVYFLCLFLVWIASLIIGLILRIFFGKEKRGAKLLGLALGAANFAIAFVLLLLPLFGTLSLTSSILHDVASYQPENQEEGLPLDQVIYYADLYEETITKKYILNTATKVLCTNKSLSCDAQFVAGGLSFEVHGEKVKLLDEYLSIKDAIPSIIKVVNVVNELNSEEVKIVKLSNFTDDDIENISSILKDSKLIRVIIPAILEYSVYSMRNDENGYGDILKKLNDLDWNEELNSIAAIIDVLKEHNELEINVGEIDYIIKSEGVINLVEDLLNGTLKVKLITEVLIPLGIDMLEEQFTSGDFKDYNIDFSNIKTINWATSGTEFVSTALNIYREYLNVDIDFTDFKVALNDEKLPDFVSYTFDEIEKSTIITDNLLPILMQVLLANLEKNESLSNLDINFDELKEVNWKNNLDQIKVLVHDLIISYQTLDINPDDYKAVLKNNKLQTELSKAITNILDCEVFADYILPIVMNVLVEKLETNESLSSFGFDFAQIKNTNWKTEISSIKDILIEFLDAYQGLDFNKDEWTKILDNENLATYIKDIFEASKSSTVISNHIIPKLPNKLHELIDNMDSSIDISFLKELITEESINQLLTNDVEKLIDVFKEIKTLGLLDKQELDFNDPTTQDTLIKVIKKVFDLSVVEGKEETIFKSIISIINIEETLAEYSITLNYENVSDWNTEVDYMCTIFKNAMSITGGLDNLDFSSLLTDVRTDEEKTMIAEIVAAIGYSDVFGDSIYTILDTVSTNIDPNCDIELTNEEKHLIEEVNGWNFEAMHLLNLVEKIENVDLDKQYEDLDADAVKDLMIYSSESVISTKVLGTVLNNIFTGVVHEDFTDQAVMKSSSDVVYNAIVVASLVQDNTLDLNNTEVTDTLISSIKNIAESEENIELSNQIINDIIGNETHVEYTQKDISDAADVVESIIETYQNSTDQDNFDLDNLSEEDLEKLESSALAKTILEKLFK